MTTHKMKNIKNDMNYTKNVTVGGLWMCASWTPSRWSHNLIHYNHTFVTVHNHCKYCAVIYCYYNCL